MSEVFSAACHQAQETLMWRQHFQKWSYNKGWFTFEFEEGELVLLKLHSLSLLRSEPGCGRKLLMKYNGPFEIIQKFSAISYWFHMPESYSIHPVLNITHLEKTNLHLPNLVTNLPNHSTMPILINYLSMRWKLSLLIRAPDNWESGPIPVQMNLGNISSDVWG